MSSSARHVTQPCTSRVALSEPCPAFAPNQKGADNLTFGHVFDFTPKFPSVRPKKSDLTESNRAAICPSNLLRNSFLADLWHRSQERRFLRRDGSESAARVGQRKL